MLTEDAASSKVEEWGHASAALPAGPPPASYTPFPGPWGFITSGYALGLFAMVILLHRIQNVVVPPRRPTVHDLFHVHPRRLSLLKLFYYLILPIDLSSTFTRALIFFPTLYFLSKVMLLWTVILLQVADLYPVQGWGFSVWLDLWAGNMEFSDVCWFTYWTICAALCVEAFVKGLEGSTDHNTINTSPINMCGYAFLLHIYSSPITHTVVLPGQKSRPDKHVVTTIAIPLFQLWILHLLGVKQSLSKLRLIPTAVSSLLFLTHFHGVLWYSPRSYPLLNYMSCVFDTFLLSVTAITAFLNAATQLLLEGSISRPLLAPSVASSLNWEEDFPVVLLKLGTASLEATRLAGLGNELSGISAGGVAPTPTIELNRFGVVIDDEREKGGRMRRGHITMRGFTNEISDVRVAASVDGDWFNTVWYREFRRYSSTLWSVPRSTFAAFWARKHHQLVRDVVSSANGTQEEIDVAGDGIEEVMRSEGDLYERFLQGETFSDESDSEFEPSTPRNRSPSLAPSFVDSVNEDGRLSESRSDGEDESERASLYADHLTSSSTPTTSAPLLLAHFTNTSPSPLTRRRYTRLIDPCRSHSPDTDPHLDHRYRNVLGAAPREFSPEGETRRNCVICTVEPRQIICWPCRCLALCDECRANLSARSSASKHRCPCCRRTVDGYSKIYIP